MENELPYVALNWRDLYTAQQIKGRIRRLLLTVDQTGIGHIFPAESQAKKIIKLQGIVTDVGSENVPTIVRVNKSTRKNIHGNMKYFAELYLIAEWLLSNLESHGAQKLRHMVYTLYPTTIGWARAKRILLDLAVSIKVHPINLGIQTEADGRLWAADDVGLKIQTVEDVLTMAQAMEEGRKKAANKLLKTLSIRGARDSIPTRIFNLGIGEVGNRKMVEFRGVIVCEHANLNVEQEWFGINLSGVIVVMTQGYPSFAVREFLHLLYAVRPGVPFVFYADHDVAGFHIYLTLKYGSRKSAWAAPSMTCPTLQWGGPSKEQVFQHVRHYAYNQYTAIIRQKNPQWSTEKLTCTANDWLADRVPRLEKEMKKPLKTGSKKLLNTIKQNRYLQYETVEFQDALRLIAQGKGNFGLGNLSRYANTSRGKEEFVVVDFNRRTGTSSQLVSDITREEIKANQQWQAYKYPSDGPSEAAQASTAQATLLVN